ncbi:uncharacterized protein LAESUDRAFT_617668, partial [Laetiporus sulphureus 93-53]
DFLQDCLACEMSQPRFSELSFRFMEIEKVLLDVCALLSPSLAPDDVSNPDKIEALLQDIRDAQQVKRQVG